MITCLTSSPLLEKKSIDLLLHILKPETTILEALQDPITSMKGKDLIISHQSRNSELCTDSLLVGAMAISKEEIPNRMSRDKTVKADFFSWFLDCEQVEFVFSGQCVGICEGTSSFLGGRGNDNGGCVERFKTFDASIEK